MAYTEITALWTGAAGLPGYSKFKFAGDAGPADATDAADLVALMFDTIKAYLPDGVTISFDGQAQLFDGSGVLTGGVSYTPPAPVVGTSVVNYSAMSGACISWLTGFVFHGRTVRGRTFIVPLTSAAFDGAGQLSTAFHDLLESAAANMTGGTYPLCVFGGNPTDGFVISIVSGVAVSLKAAVLRSRRD